MGTGQPITGTGYFVHIAESISIFWGRNGMKTTTNKTIGARLENILDNNNITQQELAQMLGVYPSTVSQWIKNKREPQAHTIIQICETLNIKSEDLLGI